MCIRLTAFENKTDPEYGHWQRASAGAVPFLPGALPGALPGPFAGPLALPLAGDGGACSTSPTGGPLGDHGFLEQQMPKCPKESPKPLKRRHQHSLPLNDKLLRATRHTECKSAS